MGLKDLDPAERAALAVRGPMGAEEMAALPLPERWVVSRVHTLTANVTAQLEAYDFGPVRASASTRCTWDMGTHARARRRSGPGFGSCT